MPNAPRKTQEQIREDLLTDLTPEEALRPEEPAEEPDEAAEVAVPLPVPTAPVIAFAQGLEAIEQMARAGRADLIMQLARNAYTRSRQVERGE